MATKYFAIFDRQKATNSGTLPESKPTEKSLVLPAQTTAPVSSGQLESAHILKIEAESVAEAQQAVTALFPGRVTNTPVIVTEAAFKES